MVTELDMLLDMDMDTDMDTDTDMGMDMVVEMIDQEEEAFLVLLMLLDGSEFHRIFLQMKQIPNQLLQDRLKHMTMIVQMQFIFNLAD